MMNGSKKKTTNVVDKPINFVQKHMNTFNKSTVHEDRKKAFKSGKRKHKGKDYDY